jgi:hypothetical protein
MSADPLSQLTGMRPLAELPDTVGRAIRFVLLDIDDTLAANGLTAAAYAALERRSERGYSLIPVTGRPAGWCDLIVRFWPVDAVVGENGAFYFRYDRAARAMIRVRRMVNRTRSTVYGTPGAELKKSISDPSASMEPATRLR